MRLTLLWLFLSAALVLLYSCAGSVREPGDPGGDELPELEYDLVTDEDSSISADEVDGEMTEVDDALAGRDTSALPGGYRGVQGMHFTPHSPPGSGFSGQITVRITYPGTQPNEYNGVRLFLFYVDPATLATTQIDSARATSGNWITFDLDALGYFVIAENLSIPRPGLAFTVAAFADLSQTSTGTTINFFAVPQNGTEPISYEWNMADGTLLTGAEVSHAYSAAGTYNVVLTATDADGNIAPTSSTPIEVTSSATPLEGVEIDAVQGATPLEWQLSSSIAGGDGPFQYAWDFDGDGVSDSALASPLASYSEAGCYEASLEVTDANGAQASAVLIIDARSIDLFAQPTSGEAPMVVDFSQSDFLIGSGDTLSIDFGDGTVVDSLSASQTHTYQSAGTFQAVATASCEIGGETVVITSNAVSITVAARPIEPYIQLTQPINPDPASPDGFSLHGFNFGESQGNSSIVAPGAVLIVDSWSENRIDLSFEQAPTQPIVELSLTTSQGSSNTISVVLNTQSVSAAVQNVIADFNFTSAPVLVVGHGFGDTESTVTVNGTIATATAWSDNAILLNLPAGIAPGTATLAIQIDALEDFSFNLRSGFLLPPKLELVDPEVRIYGGNDPDTSYSGFGFGDGTDGKQLFCDGLCLPISSWSDSQIVTTDPERPYQGFAVALRYKVPSNSLPAASIRQPQLDELNPSSITPGAPLRLIGSGFGTRAAGDRVTLDGLELPVLDWTDTLITVSIPPAANDGDVRVEKLLSSNALPLKVLPPQPDPPDGGQF